MGLINNNERKISSKYEQIIVWAVKKKEQYHPCAFVTNENKITSWAKKTTLKRVILYESEPRK